MFHSRLFASFLLLAFLLTGAAAQSQDRSKLEKKIESLIEKLKSKEQEFLAPASEDQVAFAAFLRQPDTGLLRLLPREKYDGKLLTSGGGAYYSFTRLAHEYGLGSDINLEQNRLKVGFVGADFGFLTRLGDVSIETVSLQHPGVQYLAAFNAPSKDAEAREEYRRGHPGFDVGGFTYANHLPALANSAYALRSISYRNSDVLVVFRVVRQDSDGSLVLLWKILKRFPVPQFTP
jgi:hypothetical protein